MATNNDARLEFFMPYLPYPSDLMNLPQSFSRYLPRPLPERVIIKNSSGNFWRVRVKGRNQSAYFASGWKTFAQDNNLRAGEFMVFEYKPPATFHVSIYGLSSCREKRAQVEIQEISEEEDVIEAGDSNDICSPLMEEDISDEDFLMDTTIPESITKLQIGGKKGQGASSKRKGLVVENPERYLDDPTNPFFVTELKNRKFELLVPTQMVRDCNLRFSKTIRFIDEFPSEKLEGKRVPWKDKRVCINRWARVCRRNKIKPEDKIICELLREQGTVYAIKIHIIRG
ncbi:PREDICTED: B3 domain-containing protein REM21-like [Tarenaya hassleriana]|uniref:B3 domain-containing protein REM21-like n=1 Tax=Tarenaya hassleriana TaxID=28532 RepID=UPI00053C3F45|nr:PREDICTED: B3 domain-containing protein REM21-like [Tarenaya hassleriana]